MNLTSEVYPVSSTYIAVDEWTTRHRKLWHTVWYSRCSYNGCTTDTGRERYKGKHITGRPIG